MKNSITPTLICLTQLVCLIVYLPISHCRVIIPNGANLMDLTCQKTLYYDLCFSSLDNDPRSANADVAGLGAIIVDVLKSKATDSLNKINELRTSRGTDPKLAGPLSSCHEYYKTAIENDVTGGSDGFNNGNPQLADDSMSDAAIIIGLCESGFPQGTSPLTDKNTVAHNLASVAASIARSLF